MVKRKAAAAIFFDSERKKNESLITYYDNEKQAYRSFKVANLIKIG